jgi:hypothetical protein
LAIGVIAAGDLVAYRSQTLGISGLGVVDHTGPDVYLNDPANPAHVPTHITTADVVAVYSASSTK